jgi:hypothetical protein
MCEIWGFHSAVIVRSSRMGCGAVSLGELLPTIRRIVLSSSSGFGLLYPEGKRITFFRNVGNILSNDTE